jgi:hypothetical protein
MDSCVVIARRVIDLARNGMSTHEKALNFFMMHVQLPAAT